jgi:hypothetical protein
METSRKDNGQFGAGNRANPAGRPRKGKSMLEEVARELRAMVTITENGKRKRVSKLAANAKQIANQGASGEIKAAKMAVDFALRAEKEREAPPGVTPFSHNDRDIVERFIARLKLTEFWSADPEPSKPAPAEPELPSQSNQENPDAHA